MLYSHYRLTGFAPLGTMTSAGCGIGRVGEFQECGGGVAHAVEPVVNRLPEVIVRPECRDASFRRLDTGDRVAERPSLGQQLRLARRLPQRKVGAYHLRRRCVDRHEAAVLLQH